MAMYGVRFRNTHSRDVGLLAKTGKRPAAPPVRTVEETILYRDGNLDYSEQGGRLFYDDKLVEVEFTAIAKELSDTDRLIAAAVKWLSGGWGELIFDDMPLVKWLAKPIDLSDISFSLYRIGKFTVQFRCRPFNHLLFDSLGLPLDSPVPLDSGIPLDWGKENTYLMPEVGTYTFYHDNLGDVAARPKIHIVGREDSGSHRISVLVNDDGFTLQFPSGSLLSGGQTATVDCEECTVTKGGADITGYLVSSSTDFPEFPELKPGKNTITVNTQITGQLKIDYEMPYLYAPYDLGGMNDA